MSTPRLTRADRVRHMLAIAAAHEGERMTILEFARLCGRSPGERFTRDLSYARHVALEEGHKLSHTAVVDGCHVLVYQTVMGDDVTFKAMQKIASTAATYTRNTGKAGAWEAEHGTTRLRRAIGRFYERDAEAARIRHEALRDFIDGLRNDDDGGAGAPA